MPAMFSEEAEGSRGRMFCLWRETKNAAGQRRSGRSSITSVLSGEPRRRRERLFPPVLAVPPRRGQDTSPGREPGLVNTPRSLSSTGQPESDEPAAGTINDSGARDDAARSRRSLRGTSISQTALVTAPWVRYRPVGSLSPRGLVITPMALKDTVFSLSYFSSTSDGSGRKLGARTSI